MSVHAAAGVPAGDRGLDPAPSSGRQRSLRWPQRLLTAIAVLCLGISAAVFVTAWRRPAPPRADLIAMPQPSLRQQQVFDVMRRWYDAKNRADGAALRKLTCAHPGKYVEQEVVPYEQGAENQAIAYFEAVAEFRDQGTRVWANLAVRVRPLSEGQQRLSEEIRHQGGFFFDQYTFIEEGGELKVCDADSPPVQ